MRHQTDGTGSSLDGPWGRWETGQDLTSLGQVTTVEGPGGSTLGRCQDRDGKIPRLLRDTEGSSRS